jgi:hypothetical protein
MSFVLDDEKMVTFCRNRHDWQPILVRPSLRVSSCGEDGDVDLRVGGMVVELRGWGGLR